MTKFGTAVLLLSIAATCRTQTLDHIFELATKKDSAALLKLASQTSFKATSLNANAVNLALYMSEPSRFEHRFVQHFPTDSNGVMQELYSQIELKSFTPEFLFSFKRLGAIARHGSPTAAKRLLQAIEVADGAVGEQLCSDTNQLFIEKPTLALNALSSLPVHSRRRVYSCFRLLDEDERRQMLTSVGSTAPRSDHLKRISRDIRRVLQSDSRQ